MASTAQQTRSGGPRRSRLRAALARLGFRKPPQDVAACGETPRSLVQAVATKMGTATLPAGAPSAIARLVGAYRITDVADICQLIWLAALGTSPPTLRLLPALGH